MEKKTVENTSLKLSAHLIRQPRFSKQFANFCLIVLAIFILFLFLPWTQNIMSNGRVTTYKPQDRPQTIQSIIAGKVKNWYVQEGQHVNKGDTIVELTEIKDKYFDPQLLVRLQEQITSKQGSLSSNTLKIQSLGNQIKALQSSLDYSLQKARNKLKQSQLKVISDSMDVKASFAAYEIAVNQLKRADTLLNKNLISLTEHERRKLKAQETQAYMVSAENKLMASRQEFMNANIELSSLQAEYLDKISKAESELNAALSYFYQTEADISKMNNDYANMSIRSGYYFVTAPQSGFIVQASISGVGEIVKEGQAICTIMPEAPEMAAEIFVRPMDIVLLKRGSKVRLQFDGWPIIFFSGWPAASFGTFSGEVAVIDYIDTDGKYRILVTPDAETDKEWPDMLKVGTGVKGWMMLQDVPIWYELWRQFNGFPPEYTGYQNNDAKSKSKKENAPIDEE
ncbi:MAG: HlyD family efflux transporter periplasmic adaptor subunit [Bacteroidetes bacterium]|nr:HlyD family efflux transporter periplasmic adaptor subunit [Bacteroidota bacterium]